MKFKAILFSILSVAALNLATPAVAQDADKSPETAPAASSAVSFEAPLLITDIGQGNSSKLVEALVKRAGGFEYTSDGTAKSDQLEGNKTLIVGVGASSKGLGAAGLNADQEYERGAALLEAAKSAGVPVIGVHIGGIPRRGELSDKFNKQVFEQSTVFIAWNGGNEDGFFTKLSEETGIPLILTEDKRAVGSELVTLLNDGFKAESEEATPASQPAASE